MPNCIALMFLSVTFWVWQSSAGSEGLRVLKSSSVALPCVVLFGQGGRQITDCSCWHQASAKGTEGCSHSSHSAVVGLQLIQRTNELSKSHAFQMFGGTLLVCMWRCWPPFQKIMAELTSFKCKKLLWPSLPHWDLTKGMLSIQMLDLWKTFKYFSGTVRSHSFLSLV